MGRRRRSAGLGTGQHRADAARRLRPLAPRGRHAPRSSRSPPTGSRCSSGRRRRRRRAGDGPLDAPARRRCRPGAGRCPRARARTTRCSRGPGTTFEPDVLGGAASSGEQFSPVIGGDYCESSALPVGVFEMVVENPGPEPLTVGLMLSWQNRAADPTRPAPRRRPGTRPSDARARRRRSSARRRRRAPTACAARSRSPAPASAGRRRLGRDARSIAVARRGAVGGLRGRRPARARPTDRRPSASPARRSGRRVAATVELAPGECAVDPRSSSPGTCRSSSSVAGRRWWKRLHAGLGTDRASAPVRPRRARARCARRRGAAAIEAWQAPDPRRPGAGPDWYKAALFNELYFLVDGGTFWEARRGRAAPDADDRPDDAGGPSAVRPIECFDYPFYDTLDVDFYASFARPPALARARARGHPRPARRDPSSRRPGDRRRSSATRQAGAAQVSAGALPHDVGGPRRRPVPAGRTRYRYQDINVWKDLEPQVRPPGLARRGRALGRRRRAAPRRLAGGRRGRSTTSAGVRPRRRRAARARRRPRPDVRHVADDRAAAYCGVALAGGAPGGDRDRRWPGRLGTGRRPPWHAARAGSSGDGGVRVAALAGDHYRYDDGGGASSDSIMADQLAGQWYADATGLGDIVAAGSRRDGAADDPRD